jgi:uncharacterized membrane protein YgcG
MVRTQRPSFIHPLVHQGLDWLFLGVLFSGIGVLFHMKGQPLFLKIDGAAGLVVSALLAAQSVRSKNRVPLTAFLLGAALAVALQFLAKILAAIAILLIVLVPLARLRIIPCLLAAIALCACLFSEIPGINYHWAFVIIGLGVVGDMTLQILLRIYKPKGAWAEFFNCENVRWTGGSAGSDGLGGFGGFGGGSSGGGGASGGW